MRGLWSWILLLLIIGLTALSVVTVWPSEPDRYLPNFIPWPEGKGIKLTLPTIQGGTFGLSTIERRAMSLGLDLRGGTRLVLEPEGDIPPEIDLEDALEGARRIIERRVNEFGVAESEVNILSNRRLSVQLPGIDPGEAIDKIGRTALLQFCEPVTDELGNVAVVRDGTVQYESQSCQPARDAAGEIIVESATNDQGNIVGEGAFIEFVPWARSGTPQAGANPSPQRIVWQPAIAEDENGVETELTGRLLRPNTFVFFEPVLNRPILQFEWTSEGRDASEIVTTRLIERNYPLAPFLDGEPVPDSNGLPIAPTIEGVITSQGNISGLDVSEAQELATLLNTGAFPIPLRVVQQQDVDATLGENAVRNSVIAGEVALILIMVFMVLYYRLPGVVASLALIIYTGFVLAVFKLWPITLTLAGVGAFVLSVGVAVDANILIFERMKEELRVGRNLIGAVNDGFNRAWSSIRDSNISTLITCAILYWFGNQFDESSIKGFAVTLAIGVAVSMFSAITVTRTFLLLIVRYRPIARRLWLFIPDSPDDIREEGQQLPAMAGGSSRQQEER
ncbi:MAG: protein translocase subunit SecD [Chloroflexi bacterium]|nr:protein translocase subunit SecD [Chloroflexota bacterium]